MNIPHRFKRLNSLVSHKVLCKKGCTQWVFMGFFSQFCGVNYYWSNELIADSKWGI